MGQVIFGGSMFYNIQVYKVFGAIKLNPAGQVLHALILGTVSYTHLDVYKRQTLH